MGIFLLESAVDYEKLINRLVELSEEPSYTIPKELKTRDEIIDWMKQKSEELKQMYILTAESILTFDDSEHNTEVLGGFELGDEKKLLELVDGYWWNKGEEILNEAVVQGVLNSIEDGSFSFSIIEDDSTVDFESCRREFTFTVSLLK